MRLQVGERATDEQSPGDLRMRNPQLRCINASVAKNENVNIYDPLAPAPGRTAPNRMLDFLYRPQQRFWRELTMSLADAIEEARLVGYAPGGRFVYRRDHRRPDQRGQSDQGGEQIAIAIADVATEAKQNGLRFQQDLIRQSWQASTPRSRGNFQPNRAIPILPE